MIKVLVVDDDTDLLDMVTLVLSNYKMNVSPLAECLQFEQSVSASKPDIVLMDIYLGDCDGRKLCRKLKESRDYSDIPVILYSAGNIHFPTIEEALADDFMAKPFDIHHLVQKINSHLGSRSGNAMN